MRGVPSSITTWVRKTEPWAQECPGSSHELNLPLRHDFQKLFSWNCICSPRNRQFYAPRWLDFPSDMDRVGAKVVRNKFDMEMDGNAWPCDSPVSTTGKRCQEYQTISDRWRCWIYHRTQILCDFCKSTSSICSSTASEKTRTRREPNMTNPFIQQRIEILCVSFVWMASDDGKVEWKSLLL